MSKPLKKNTSQFTYTIVLLFIIGLGQEHGINLFPSFYLKTDNMIDRYLQ